MYNTDGVPSIRKPYNNRAGYVASRINALTNDSNVIYIASEQGVDADHKYVTVCEKHSTMISSTSVPKARTDMKDASMWCNQCELLRTSGNNEAQPAVVETPEVESEQDEEYEEPREDLYRECEFGNEEAASTVSHATQYIMCKECGAMYTDMHTCTAVIEFTPEPTRFAINLNISDLYVAIVATPDGVRHVTDGRETVQDVLDDVARLYGHNTINTSLARVQELSQWPVQTQEQLQHTSQEGNVAQSYPFLKEWVDGKLKGAWLDVRLAMTDDGQTITEQRAGELAAAKIAVMIGDECGQLEKDTKAHVHGKSAQWEGDSVTHFYDTLQETRPTYRSLLQDWSGNRAMLIDEQDYREEREKVQLPDNTPVVDSIIPSDITLTVGEATVANDAQYVYWRENESPEVTAVCTECDELHHTQDTLCPKCRAFYQHGLDLCNKFDKQTSRPLQQNDRIEKLLHTGMTYEQIQIAVKALDAARTQLEHLASKEQGDQQNEDTTIYHQEIERGLHGR